MTTVDQPPLWLPGWEHDEPTPAPRRYRPWIGMPDEARPATRRPARSYIHGRRIRTIRVRGDLL